MTVGKLPPRGEGLVVRDHVTDGSVRITRYGCKRSAAIDVPLQAAL